MTAALVQRVLNGLLHKYLKNVTTETATLWGGELVFKNVELRLDVLQEELGLPLVFSRGFIQELKVFLPLRNLLREQVRITLSNIEVVAQTPKEVDENNTMRFPGGAASNSSPAKQGQHKARGGGQEGEDGGMNEGGEGGEEGAQGWVRSMLARIALNIKVQVNNVVIKYVSERYVSSMSCKSLLMEAVNSNWEACFADYEGPARAAFKVIRISDVTWCLDEACESGKVSHYEKPLFNRAQIEARLILRDTPNGHGRRGKRPLGLPLAQMHVRIGTVDMTVTDKQVKIMLLLADEIDRMLTTIRLSKESTTRSSNAGAGGAGGGSHNGGQLGVLDELQDEERSRRRWRGGGTWAQYALSLIGGEGREADVYDEDSIHSDVLGDNAAGNGVGNAGVEGPRVRHKNELVLCICVDRMDVHLRRSTQGGMEQQEKLLHLMVEGGVFMHRSQKWIVGQGASHRGMCSSGKGLHESWGSVESEGGAACAGGGGGGSEFAYTQVLDDYRITIDSINISHPLPYGGSYPALSMVPADIGVGRGGGVSLWSEEERGLGSEGARDLLTPVTETPAASRGISKAFASPLEAHLEECGSAPGPGGGAGADDEFGGFVGYGGNVGDGGEGGGDAEGAQQESEGSHQQHSPCMQIGFSLLSHRLPRMDEVPPAINGGSSSVPPSPARRTSSSSGKASRHNVTPSKKIVAGSAPPESISGSPNSIAPLPPLPPPAYTTYAPANGLIIAGTDSDNWGGEALTAVPLVSGGGGVGGGGMGMGGTRQRYGGAGSAPIVAGVPCAGVAGVGLGDRDGVYFLLQARPVKISLFPKFVSLMEDLERTCVPASPPTSEGFPVKYLARIVAKTHVDVLVRDFSATMTPAPYPPPGEGTRFHLAEGDVGLPSIDVAFESGHVVRGDAHAPCSAPSTPQAESPRSTSSQSMGYSPLSGGVTGLVVSCSSGGWGTPGGARNRRAITAHPLEGTVKGGMRNGEVSLGAIFGGRGVCCALSGADLETVCGVLFPEGGGRRTGGAGWGAGGIEVELGRVSAGLRMDLYGVRVKGSMSRCRVESRWLHITGGASGNSGSSGGATTDNGALGFEISRAWREQVGGWSGSKFAISPSLSCLLNRHAVCRSSLQAVSFSFSSAPLLPLLRAVMAQRDSKIAEKRDEERLQETEAALQKALSRVHGLEREAASLSQRCARYESTSIYDSYQSMMSGPSDVCEGGGGANAGGFRGVMVNSSNSLGGGNFPQHLHNRGGEREGKGGGEEGFSPPAFDKAKDRDRRGMAVRGGLRKWLQRPVSIVAAAYALVLHASLLYMVSQQSPPMTTASSTQHVVGPVSFRDIQPGISPSGGPIRGGDDGRTTERSGGRSLPGRDSSGRIVGGEGPGRGSERGPNSGQVSGFSRDGGSGSPVDDEKGPGVEEAVGSRDMIDTKHPGEGGELQRHVHFLSLEAEKKQDDADDAPVGDHRGGDATFRDGDAHSRDDNATSRDGSADPGLRKGKRRESEVGETTDV